MKMMKRPKFTLYVCLTVGLVVLFLYGLRPLAPFLGQEFDPELAKSNEIVVRPVVSTGVPAWGVENGRENLQENPYCDDTADYAVGYAFLEWPENLSPPFFQTSFYPLWPTENHDRLLARGKIVGCRPLPQEGDEDLYFPVFQVDTWVSDDKTIFAFTEAGRMPACLFITLVFLGLIPLGWKLIGDPDRRKRPR